MKNNQHVVPYGKDWTVKGENNEKYTKILPIQKEAIKVARKIAINQESELIVHGNNGQIRQKESFGNDPKNIKG